MAGVIFPSSVGEKINLYVVILGKPEGNRKLGRLRPRWNNIKIYLK